MKQHTPEVLRSIGRENMMKSSAAILLLFLVLAPPASYAASTGAELVAEVNAIRARGCDRRAGVAAALQHEPRLDRVAQALASGRRQSAAMQDAGYVASQSAALEASGSDVGIARALASRGCADIANPEYRDIGVALRPGQAWIVLAIPVSPPAPGESQAIGRRMLELVNEARARSRRCGWKRFAAAAPLVTAEALHRAAQAHARDMASRGELSHKGADGSTHAERATRAGYRWRAVGENIAAGQSTPEQVVAGWLRSPRHCANLMDADYAEMGAAYAFDAGSAAGIYWVQLLGSPRR